MTELYQDKYRIPSARRPGYDYGQSGVYFVTICTQNSQPYFGAVEVPAGDWAGAFVRQSAIGKRAAECWAMIPQFAPFVQLDAFVLMPDHLHGVLVFDKDGMSGSRAEDGADGENGADDGNGADRETRSIASLRDYKNRFGPQVRNLASVLRGFKSAVTTFARHQAIEFQWQPRYHDRIVRNQNELARIQEYIITNPSRWKAEYDNSQGLFR